MLDRPNPIGGAIVEGPVLEPAYESFIGLYPIPIRHGMTVGELATLFNDRFGIGAKLRVVRMNGWRRSMIWPDTGLQWVQTSPNIPTWQTTVVYVGTGLLDSAGINNGSGFTLPFFLAGAAGIDGTKLAMRLNSRNLPGVWFRPAAWSPLTGFWEGHELTGVELVFSIRAAFLRCGRRSRSPSPFAISFHTRSTSRVFRASTATGAPIRSAKPCSPAKRPKQYWPNGRRASPSLSRCAEYLQYDE